MVARACHAGRRAGRRLVDGLSRLRERFLDARTPDAARSGGMDQGRLVPRQGRRFVTAHREASERQAVYRIGMPLSDDFSSNRFGVLWGFYNPGPNEMSRVQYQTKALRIAGKGSQPNDCSPLVLHRAGHCRIE